MPNVKQEMLENRYGDLIVKREVSPDVFFCVCEPLKGQCAIEGGGTRELTRRQLQARSVSSCAACGVQNRKTAWESRKRKSVVEPVPERLVKIEIPKCHPFCTDRVERGVRYRAHQIDCARLNFQR